MEQHCILVLSVQDMWTGGLFVKASKVVSFTTTISHNIVTIYEQSYVSPVYLMFLLFFLLSWCFDSDIPPGVSSNRDKVEDCKNARKIQPGWTGYHVRFLCFSAFLDSRSSFFPSRLGMIGLCEGVVEVRYHMFGQSLFSQEVNRKQDWLLLTGHVHIDREYRL